MFLLLGILGFGMLVGAAAQFILGREHGRVNWTIALVAGIGGSFVGGLIASLLAGDGLRFRPSGVIGSIVGAIIVTAIWQVVARRKRQAAAAAAPPRHARHGHTHTKR